MPSVCISKIKPVGCDPSDAISLQTQAQRAKKQNLEVGSARTARRLTFVHAATKVSKNALLLAEGIFLCQVSEESSNKEHNKPARYRGPHGIAFMSGYVQMSCLLDIPPGERP